MPHQGGGFINSGYSYPFLSFGLALWLFFVPQLYAVHVWHEPDRSAFFAEWIFCSRKELRGSRRKAERFFMAIGSKIIKIRMKETGSPGSPALNPKRPRKDARVPLGFLTGLAGKQKR